MFPWLRVSIKSPDEKLIDKFNNTVLGYGSRYCNNCIQGFQRNCLSFWLPHSSGNMFNYCQQFPDKFQIQQGACKDEFKYVILVLSNSIKRDRKHSILEKVLMSTIRVFILTSSIIFFVDTSLNLENICCVGLGISTITFCIKMSGRWRFVILQQLKIEWQLLWHFFFSCTSISPHIPLSCLQLSKFN